MNLGSVLWIAASAVLDVVLTAGFCWVSFRMGRDVGYRERMEQEKANAKP